MGVRVVVAVLVVALVIAVTRSRVNVPSAVERIFTPVSIVVRHLTPVILTFRIAGRLRMAIILRWRIDVRETPSPFQPTRPLSFDSGRVLISAHRVVCVACLGTAPGDPRERQSCSCRDIQT